MPENTQIYITGDGQTGALKDEEKGKQSIIITIINFAINSMTIIFIIIIIILNSVPTQQVLVPSLFLPPCGAVTLHPFTDSLCHSLRAPRDEWALAERSRPHDWEALCRKGDIPTFHFAQKLKFSCVKIWKKTQKFS